MSKVQLGSFADPAAARDAVHVAVVAVMAAEPLNPGMHVRLVDGRAYENKLARGIGIVDPFLTCGVEAGTWFWLCLYPETVTNLRHDWSHEALDRTAFQTAKTWMEALAAVHKITYDQLINAASECVKTGLPTIEDNFTEIETPPEFWLFYQIITGQKANPELELFGCCI